MQRAEEHKLIERAAAGDKAAAAALIRAHQQSVYGYLLRMSGRPDVAEDIVQEAFVRVLTNLHRFDFRYRFSTWLFTIARRLYMNAMAKHRPAYDSEIVGSWQGDGERPEAAAWDAERQGRHHDALQVALQELSTEQREVLILFHQLDWPIALIAEQLGMPEGTVKSHLHRGRKRLRQVIVTREDLSERLVERADDAGPGSNLERPRLGRIPDELVDAVLDGEVDTRAGREILDALRRHPEQRREVSQTLDAIDAIRRPVHGPDLTECVLHEANRRRRFLPTRVRRMVTRGRAAVAASLMLVLLGYAGAQRAWPDASVFNRGPAPVTEVANAFTGNAAGTMAIVSTQCRELENGLSPLPVPVAAVPRLEGRFESHTVSAVLISSPVRPVYMLVSDRHQGALMLTELHASGPMTRVVGTNVRTKAPELERDTTLP